VGGRGSGGLVSAARTGDQLAWAALYSRHAGRLVVWLRWLPLADAAISPDDVASQAWLTAASKIHEFDGSDEAFAGWLFGIARRHALNHYRRGMRRRTSPMDLEEMGESISTRADDGLARVEDHDTTRRLLEMLSPREAEVIACNDVVGLDVRSTAGALEMTTTAVRVARHRGMVRLRRLLETQDDAGSRHATADDSRG
jgi:RNA polymerase sigma-70 factor (ECF subfamily)